MKNYPKSRRQALVQPRWVMQSLVILALGATSAVAKALVCPAVVVGTNNAAIDVQQVQEAVDRCASVVLQGRFRFTGTNTDGSLRVVTVRKSVHIAGQLDDQGRMPQVIGGYTPILIKAPDSNVQIKDLRFINPVFSAIKVGSAREVVIANCVIKGVIRVPFGVQDVSLGIEVGGESPISRLELVDNTISDPNTPIGVGIIVAPSNYAIASITISRNVIRATAHGVDLRSAGGNIYVDHNQITIANSARSGDVGSPPLLVDGIRCWGIGACNILGNVIASEHPNSAGIRLQGTSGAIVENNIVQMSPPDGSTPGVQSCGVQLIEHSKRNLVGRNQVGGSARTAFSVSGPLDYVPADNVFVRNRHPGFAASFVDTEIDAGALRTVIVDENGSISDLGSASIVR